MAKRTVYHVAPTEEGWKVEKEHAQRASATADTKAEAIARAVELAKNASGLSQVKIHKGNGVIESERTYGADPEKYPG
ncbi:MAG: DUF2188 domain-containing protein [Bryobacteraceae bacterium]